MMASAESAQLCESPRSPAIFLSIFSLLAGAGGMAMSCLFLASPHQLDVLAGAVGFVTGVVLVGAGLLSLAVQSRSTITNQTALHAIGCLVAFLPPAVALLEYPIVYLIGAHDSFFDDLFAVFLMLLVSIGCLAWGLMQGRGVAVHLSELFKTKQVQWLRVFVFLTQFLAIGGTAFAYTPAAQWATSRKGEHKAWSEVQNKISLSLPPTASDIRFYQHWHPDRVITADFAIDEKNFLTWAAFQGWALESHANGITIWPRAHFGDWNTQAVVTDGYHCDNISRGATNTFSITYDRTTHRAYYHFNSNRLGDD